MSNSNENYTYCVNITVRHTFKTLKVVPTGSYCIILCPTVHYWVISGHILHLVDLVLCCVNVTVGHTFKTINFEGFKVKSLCIALGRLHLL